MSILHSKVDLRWEIGLDFVLYSILTNLFTRIWYVHSCDFQIRICGIFVERFIDLWYKCRCIHARVGNAFTIPPSDNTFLYINYHHHRWNILNSRMTSHTSKTSSKGMLIIFTNGISSLIRNSHTLSIFCDIIQHLTTLTYQID